MQGIPQKKSNPERKDKNDSTTSVIMWILLLAPIIIFIGIGLLVALSKK